MSEVGRGIYSFSARIRTPRGPQDPSKVQKFAKKVKKVQQTRDFEPALI